MRCAILATGAAGADAGLHSQSSNALWGKSDSLKRSPVVSPGVHRDHSPAVPEGAWATRRMGGCQRAACAAAAANGSQRSDREDNVADLFSLCLLLVKAKLALSSKW